ncbi:MAG TPA: hypothetical protein VNJ11_11090 [Bryobacteraceae bacterium]|nr:hypothetical protein [Bryobacteraceae bacterium]
MLDSFDERLRGDYDVEVLIDPQSVSRRIEQAREFLEAVERFIEGGQ